MYDPASLFQGHAVWHVFTAIGIHTLFRLLERMRYPELAPAEAFAV